MSAVVRAVWTHSGAKDMNPYGVDSRGIAGTW
jgi:hypothetical protein